ncbi:MAG: hypothetical protein WA966_07830 [Ornithinimicrobium sp.]
MRDEEAFVEFAATASARLRRTAFLLCGDWDRAADHAQEGLIWVYVAWPRLTRAGHFDGVAGIAIGHITGTPANAPLDAIELLREHLAGFGVPVLGGLPIGHDADARSVLIGASTEIDAAAGTLMQ